MIYNEEELLKIYPELTLKDLYCIQLAVIRNTPKFLDKELKECFYYIQKNYREKRDEILLEIRNSGESTSKAYVNNNKKKSNRRKQWQKKKKY